MSTIGHHNCRDAATVGRLVRTILLERTDAAFQSELGVDLDLKPAQAYALGYGRLSWGADLPEAALPTDAIKPYEFGRMTAEVEEEEAGPRVSDWELDTECFWREPSAVESPHWAHVEAEYEDWLLKDDQERALWAQHQVSTASVDDGSLVH